MTNPIALQYEVLDTALIQAVTHGQAGLPASDNHHTAVHALKIAVALNRGLTAQLHAFTPFLEYHVQ
jgi:acid phosphatase family membrane protein YuiD